MYPIAASVIRSSTTKQVFTTRFCPNQFLRKMHVYSLPMRWGFGDNYAYVVQDDETKEATVIDPAAPDDILGAIKKLESEGLKLTSITNTHHHYDHSDGNPVFRQLYPKVPLYAGKDSPLVTITPGEGEKHRIGANIEVTAIHTPCHTKDSISWFAHDLKTGQKAVFSGDTLFICGCGRFFEGDANDMHASMAKFGKLPQDTVVYPGHEYTKSNVKFAVSVDPENSALRKLEKFCNENEKTTGKFTIGDELEYNPFMRTDVPEVQKLVGEHSAVSTMAKLRKMKDRF